MDLDAILMPIPGDNPSGENLRYTTIYDEIQEARKADDLLDQGDWQHEVKTSDWNAVFSLSMDALETKTKDLQIAAWLLEALTHTKGFEGISLGLTIINNFFDTFWETLYPEIEEDDLDYRAGPFEFINDKLWFPIKEIPITDPGSTPGFSWMKWKESRKVGLEKDTLNQYGDVDDDKKKARDEQIAEGKLSAEEFDAAVKRSSRAYYEDLFEILSQCGDLFNVLDNTVDEKFGKEAPRLAEFKTSLEDCLNLVTKFVKIKREEEPDPVPEELQEESKEPEGAVPAGEGSGLNPAFVQAQVPVSVQGGFQAGTYHVNRILGSAGIEEAVWQDALKKLGKEGIKPALEQLLGASCSAQSIREKTNFRLLMARLCLKAGRPDLARPIMEELNTLIDELALERWESPIWIAEALGTLYQCLTAEGASGGDQDRANEILTRLCTLDVTKAMEYSNRGTD
ncbi:MAG: type VI secretion system protein TssA [Desulfobacula sp.]|uniref:type VI secretion system protein TssA n=1 Tax=Desulfobacula sp. TaxID=2593537 RepID=UPI0025C244DE|nr:type VI secretion system protein TssA [Desulfobacula sp.]MCD4721628.1 type VI secretion system protein TssA [Desulfobacula sp.]